MIRPDEAIAKTSADEQREMNQAEPEIDRQLAKFTGGAINVTIAPISPRALDKLLARYRANGWEISNVRHDNNQRDPYVSMMFTAMPNARLSAAT
jgi:DNA-binding IclR family transcriptional regulator